MTKIPSKHAAHPNPSQIKDISFPIIKINKLKKKSTKIDEFTATTTHICLHPCYVGKVYVLYLYLLYFFMSEQQGWATN